MDITSGRQHYCQDGCQFRYDNYGCGGPLDITSGRQHYCQDDCQFRYDNYGYGDLIDITSGRQHYCQDGCQFRYDNYGYGGLIDITSNRQHYCHDGCQFRYDNYCYGDLIDITSNRQYYCHDGCQFRFLLWWSDWYYIKPSILLSWWLPVLIFLIFVMVIWLILHQASSITVMMAASFDTMPVHQFVVLPAWFLHPEIIITGKIAAILNSFTSESLHLLSK
jgi:hypothetical protein